jgi:hypothetical protein
MNTACGVPIEKIESYMIVVEQNVSLLACMYGLVVGKYEK